MNGLLKTGCTGHVKRAAGRLIPLPGLRRNIVCEMHPARFGSPYVKILPRNHFTLKKMGASAAMEFNVFNP
jgi:hypothetical protein